MNDTYDAINPHSLKATRKRRNLTQEKLADAIGCTKDTVSRWERGASLNLRSRLREQLCKALRVEWKTLTQPPEQNNIPRGDTMVRVSVERKTRASLQILAERYSIDQSEILELAPLLFVIAAEQSLAEREERLDAIDAAMEAAAEKVAKERAHLPVVAFLNMDSEEQLQEEEKSIKNKDVFGRTIQYNTPWMSKEEHVGPFVRFVQNLAKDLPKAAVSDIDTFDGDMVEFYKIAEDTLRSSIGISEEDEIDESLLHYIRIGWIDFDECLRVKRNEDETTYRKWLLDKQSQAEEASEELLNLYSAEL